MFNSQYLRQIIYLITILGILGDAPLGLTQSWQNFRKDGRLTSIQNNTNPAPIILNIESIKYDRDRLTSDMALTVTIKATPGVVASVLLMADKHTVREIIAKEISPGIYQGTIYFDSNTRIVEGVIMARLQYGTQVIYDVVDFPVSVTLAQTDDTCSVQNSPSALFSNCDSISPQLPVNSQIPLSFISHRNGEIVNSDNLLIMGKTQPNAKVNIKVNSSLPLIGNFIELEGDILVKKTINADREGNFSFMIPQAIKTVSGLKYIISAIAISEAQTSKSVKLTLQER